MNVRRLEAVSFFHALSIPETNLPVDTFEEVKDCTSTLGLLQNLECLDVLSEHFDFSFHIVPLGISVESNHRSFRLFLIVSSHVEP
jgi:hypothetical protein